ncbi:carbohydrate binding domain-containing protein [Epilithonimonas sp. UC225_85]|uniref:carbohydrate binding domain-containing protein n=1 Tax=Epilithonimonas sp. UC225_85 TaxID=3350167 RepID=UPI0036D2D272
MKKLIFTIAFTSSIFTFGQKNLIKNGGFELDAEFWRGENILTINPYTKKSGTKAGSISEFTSPQWKGVDQEFNIPKNTAAIEVSAWLKADGVEKGKSNWNKAVMVLEIGGKNENIAELEGTTQWQLVKKIVPLNKDRSGRLMLALSECTGTLYFDEIKVIPLSQEDYNKITEVETQKHQVAVITDNTPLELLKLNNGNFEKGLDSWRGNSEVVSDEKYEGQKSLKLSSQNSVWTGIDQVADIPADAKTIDISAFAKTKDLKSGRNDWNKGVMILEFTSDGTRKISEDQMIFSISDIKEWQKFSKTLEIPKGSKRYRIMLALSEATGTMYVDDVQVKFK